VGDLYVAVMPIAHRVRSYQPTHGFFVGAHPVGDLYVAVMPIAHRVRSYQLTQGIL